MPTGPLPFDRKDFLKETSSDPVGAVPVRWRETPTTPSSHDNNRGTFSYRCGGAGGSSDFRRPFSGHRIGGWRVTTLEPLQDKLCGNGSKENNHSNGGAFGTTGGHNEKSLGSSIDWKPLKWTRSGSLSSRGSVDVKIDGVAGNTSPLESPSDDGVPPRTPGDDVTSRKKARLGWGEGLAKYEKKKVGPDDDVADKEGGPTNNVSSVEPLIHSPCSQLDKSPSLTGGSECASPATPYSFACSSSPGIEEEKASFKANAADSNPSCHISPTHTEESPFNLESLELTETPNMSSLLTELLQSDDTSTQSSGFARSTAMDKLQVWKADISRTLEITESEIDSLENELKSLGSCSLAPTEECNEEEKSGNSVISPGDMSIEKADGSEEHTGVEDLDRESPGSATSEFVEPSTSCDNNTPSDACIGDDVSNGSSSIVPVTRNVHYNREDYDSLFASNKADADEASSELSNLSSNSQWSTNVPVYTNDSLVKKNFYTRKRFLKFKERVITLKFRAFQYLWREDLRLLSVRKSGAKSHKKSDTSSRMIGFTDHQKHPSSIRSPVNAGNLSLVPTTEIIEYANKLLPDSHIKVYNKNTLKMPCMILDKNERVHSRFISDNGLVENPCEVEIERSRANVWTSEEKKIFLEKFSSFGKDFRKIASFLQRKTVADCVEFYYKHHKSDPFQKTKKHPGKSNPNNTYLLTSGKRQTQETIAASANVEETAAADVLAGICGSISSEAMSSCITGFVDSKRQLSTPDRISQFDADEDTCSDESETCEGETINPSTCDWTDEEKSSFLQAVKLYRNKDFEMISRYVKTRSGDECKVFYSKARKCLGLDSIHGRETGGVAGPNHDHDVDSGGSVISCDKWLSSEDPHSKQEVVESDQVNEGQHEPEVDGLVEVEVEFEERGINGNLVDLNSAVEMPCVDDQSNGFPAFSQDDVSSRLSFRKSGGFQRCSSTDNGYHLHLPKHSLMDCVESSQILRGFPVTVSSTVAYNEKQKNHNLSLRMCTTNANASEVGKPKPRGVKLFGQILTKSSSQQQHQSKSNDKKSFNLKFDTHSGDNSNNKNNDNGFGVEKNVPLRSSYGFWDGNRIQTVPSLPDSSILLAKYPAAFAKFEPQKSSNNQYVGIHQPFTVDKLLSEMPTRNLCSESIPILQCNGVSDPVTAIRMHYAKSYNNGSNGDIGSR